MLYAFVSFNVLTNTAQFPEYLIYYFRLFPINFAAISQISPSAELPPHVMILCVCVWGGLTHDALGVSPPPPTCDSGLKSDHPSFFAEYTPGRRQKLQNIYAD